jgi:hypothetical protein
MKWIALLTLVFACSACTSRVRMKAGFDDHLEGVDPAEQPSPNPPNDHFIWNQPYGDSRIRSCGLRAKCVQTFASPEYYGTHQRFTRMLSAGTERLTQNPRLRLRGALRINQVGDAHFAIYLMAGTRSSSGQPLAGFRMSNASTLSMAYLSPPFIRDIILNPQSMTQAGIPMGSYPEGRDIELRWSLDEADRTISLGPYPTGMPAMAGSVVFDTVGSDGRPIVPIDTIWLFIDGWDVTHDAYIITDNYFVEET